MKRLVLFVIVLGTYISAIAQLGDVEPNKSEVVYSIGASSYSGNIGSKITTVLPAAVFGYKYFLNENIAFTSMVTYAGLRGNDKITDNPRAYKFTSHLGEVSGNLEIYLLKENNKYIRFSSYKGGKKYNVFLSLGLGYAYFSPSTNFKVENQDDLLNSAYVIPVGIGYKYRVTKKWSLGVSFKHRFTVTSGIDGYKDVLNPNTNDKYNGLMIDMFYNLYKPRY